MPPPHIVKALQARFPRLSGRRFGEAEAAFKKVLSKDERQVASAAPQLWQVPSTRPQGRLSASVISGCAPSHAWQFQPVNEFDTEKN
jgi:hypothetical protein